MKVESKIKNPIAGGLELPVIGKYILNFSINLILNFFIIFILTFTIAYRLMILEDEMDMYPETVEDLMIKK